MHAAQDAAGGMCRHRQDDRPRLNRAARRVERECARMPHVGDGRTSCQRARRDRTRERINQFGNTAGQRDERPLGRRFHLQRAKRTDDAAGLSLCVDEPGKERAHRESIDISGMNPRQQRLGEIVHRLLTESPAHERADRLVLVILAARNEDLARHPQLAGEREERRVGKRAEAEREAEKGSFGQRMQASVSQDVRGTRRDR